MALTTSLSSQSDPAAKGSALSAPRANLSQRRQAPAHFLSFDHISPFKAQSNGSTHSSPYLTPPSSPAGQVSPPPRKETHEYPGRNANAQKKKRLAWKGVRSPPLKEAEQASLDRCPLMEISSDESHNASAPKSRFPIVDSGINSTSGAPMVLVTKNSATNSHVLRFEGASDIRNRKPPTDLGDIDRKDKLGANVSLAINSLRRASQVSHNRLTSEVNHPSSSSSSFTTTMNMPFVSKVANADDGGSDDENGNEKPIASEKTSLHRKSHASRVGNRPPPKAASNQDIGEGLKLPATITLRKASRSIWSTPKAEITNVAVSAELAYDVNPPSIIADSPPDPMIVSTKEPKSRDVSTNEKDETQPDANSVALDEILQRFFSKTAKSRTSLSNASELRRRSLLAETALTCADVCLAPGTFLANLPYHESSLSAIGTLRRLSAIQSRIHGSVHEIIWQENEISSSGTSPNSTSPLQASGRDTRKSSDVASRRSQSVSTILKPKIPFNSEQIQAPLQRSQSLTVSSIPGVPKFYGNMFDWSWGSRPQKPTKFLGPIEDPLSEAPIPVSTSDSACRRPSLLNSSSVQSFPPLGSRKHTSEWCNEPAVDLKDSSIGRAPHEMVQLGLTDGVEDPVDRGVETYSSTPDAVTVIAKLKEYELELDGGFEVGETHRRGRSFSVHPFSPARLREDGKVGRSVGISSHKRVVKGRQE